jgi:hypothetical protein
MIAMTDYMLFRRAVVELVESQVTLLDAALPHVNDPAVCSDMVLESTRLKELVFDLEASAP